MRFIFHRSECRVRSARGLSSGCSAHTRVSCASISNSPLRRNRCWNAIDFSPTLITVISCVCYVITWEILYYNFLPGFMDTYWAHMIAKAKASGASPEALQAKLQQLERSKQLYQNPLFNSLMTFIEPFPVGLVITLISAAILRKKRQSQAAETPMQVKNYSR